MPNDLASAIFYGILNNVENILKFGQFISRLS